MSTAILPTLAGPVPERASTAAEARPQSSPSDAWRAAFEQAGGERFGGWFQAPTDRPDAGASPGAAPLPPARAPAGAFAAATSRPDASQAATEGAGGVARAAGDAREPAATPATRREAASADAPAQPAAQTPAQTAAASMSNEPATGIESAPADAATLAATATAAQLPAILQSLLGTSVMLVADAAEAATPEASAALQSVATGAAAAASESHEDAAAVDDAAPAEEATPERGAGASTERDALRMHAEWTDAGVRVWLGADAQSLPDVAALTTQLQRWLAGQGMSLLGLVCNGRNVLDPSTQRESDAPAAPRAGRRADAALLPFDFSNLYPSETR